MDRKMTQTIREEEYVLDLSHIFKTLMRKSWSIVLAGILAAAIGFSVAAFAITPTFSSSIMLYVNNSSASMNNPNFSISSSEISAAQSLVRTYSEILNNRTTLERVIEHTDLGYTYLELQEMITSRPSNDTEIMKITVTAKDPDEAAKIANGIAEILPQRISEIIDGASMEVVEYAIPNPEKVAPNTTGFTVIGFVLGALLSTVTVVIAAMIDDTIHDEEYVIKNYNFPILAKIPDLMNSGDNRYGYTAEKNKSKN